MFCSWFCKNKCEHTLELIDTIPVPIDNWNGGGYTTYVSRCTKCGEIITKSANGNRGKT